MKTFCIILQYVSVNIIIWLKITWQWLSANPFSHCKTGLFCFCLQNKTWTLDLGSACVCLHRHYLWLFPFLLMTNRSTIAIIIVPDKRSSWTYNCFSIRVFVWHRSRPNERSKLIVKPLWEKIPQQGSFYVITYSLSCLVCSHSVIFVFNVANMDANEHNTTRFSWWIESSIVYQYHTISWLDLAFSWIPLDLVAI